MLRARTGGVRGPMTLMFCLLLAASSITACGGVDPGDPVYLPRPTRAIFEANVQPFLGERCGTRACHGDPARTLVLHAPGYHRVRPAGAGVGMDENVLSESELSWNYESLCLRMVTADTPDETLLIRKVAPQGFARRMDHARGTVVFESERDPDWLALRTWLDSAYAVP